MRFRSGSAQIRKDRRAFARWQEANPGKRYHDYYVEVVTAKLDAGKAHATLGGRLKATGEDSGASVVDFLRQRGLQPVHTCVDYGCGSLRIGEPLMRYLEPGRYWGVDVTDRFINDGLARIEPGLLRAKEPRVAVLAPSVLEDLRAAQPDYVVANAVLHHVPPFELAGFLRDLLSIAGPHTQTFVTARTSATPVQFSARSWAYPVDVLQAAAAAHDTGCEVIPGPATYKDTANAAIRNDWLRLTRTA